VESTGRHTKEGSKGSTVEGMEEREKVVCLAKLAEQAERYDGEGSVRPSVCPVLCFSSVQCRRYSLVGGVWRGIRVLLRRFCVFASIFAHLRGKCLNTGPFHRSFYPGAKDEKSLNVQESGPC
jgi:hypothetical protein